MCTAYARACACVMEVRGLQGWEVKALASQKNLVREDMHIYGKGEMRLLNVCRALQQLRA